MKLSFLSAALCLALPLAAATDITDQYKAGQHNGEVKQLDVDIRFSGSYGVTTTDAGGITYNFFGASIHENKVYPQRYWGSFPLYFFDLPVISDVVVSNLGPRQTTKIRVTQQAYALNTDGSNGVKLAPDLVRELSVGLGEVQHIDMTFTPRFVPGADSGLDRIVILVQHVNEGGQGKGNALPALILAKEAILCPPDVRAQTGR